MCGVHVENNVSVVNGHSIKNAVYPSTFRMIGTPVADGYQGLQLLMQGVLQVPLVLGECLPREVSLSVVAGADSAVAEDPETVAEVDL